MPSRCHFTIFLCLLVISLLALWQFYRYTGQISITNNIRVMGFESREITGSLTNRSSLGSNHTSSSTNDTAFSVTVPTNQDSRRPANPSVRHGVKQESSSFKNSSVGAGANRQTDVTKLKSSTTSGALNIRNKETKHSSKQLSSHSVNTSVSAGKIQVIPKKDAKCNDTLLQEFNDKQNFLCYTALSRLGNRMFIYASAYGIAARLNRTLVMCDDMVSKYFSVTTRTIDCCVTRGIKRVLSRRHGIFDSSLMNIPRGQNICVGQHLQSYKYFEHVRDEIRTQLTFRKEYRDNATRIISDAVTKYKKRMKISKSSFRPVLVGVHVRRGDMVNHHDGFDVATPSYMDKAAQYFRIKYGQVLFLVCSNDMVWSKKHMRGDDVIFIEGNHFSIDLAVLVSCNHTLSTVGSFSWWAGYLAGGDTVYYQWPAREGAPVQIHFNQNYTDYFPPTWIGMT